MKPGLSDRLARLKKAQQNPPPVKKITPKVSPEKSTFHLEGDWEQKAEHLWVKTRVCPSPLKGFRNSGLLCQEYPEQEKWLFYDTETTGLSGGAGNIAFLVGLGIPRGDQFEIRQYFLSDYPGEARMIQHLKEDMEKAELFISYNGKSFDRPLLETRFLMNRNLYKMGAQLDLLYPVRSLFKAVLPDCRLGTVEEELLQMERHNDVPGAEIPDIWLNFIKDGDHPDMNRVILHNDLDIHSLAVLLQYLETSLIDPKTMMIRDPYALGRYYLEREDERAIPYLLEAVEKRNVRAEILLSRYWKRQDEWMKALELWQSILTKRFSFFAVVELAKFYEHREKNYTEALKYCDMILQENALLRQDQKAELVHRRNRILRKREGT